MDFEWDPEKRKRNLRIHGVDFLAAAGLLLGVHYAREVDHPGEQRYLAVGPLPKEDIPARWSGPLCAVVYTMRGEGTYRIISARRARRDERRAYRANVRRGS